MPRPKGVPNVKTADFFSKWDRISKRTKVDPVDMLFKIAGGKKIPGGDIFGPGHRLEALKLLLSYRYPKLRSVEHKIADDSDGVISFRWLRDDEEEPSR